MAFGCVILLFLRVGDSLTHSAFPFAILELRFSDYCTITAYKQHTLKKNIWNLPIIIMKIDKSITAAAISATVNVGNLVVCESLFGTCILVALLRSSGILS